MRRPDPIATRRELLGLAAATPLVALTAPLVGSACAAPGGDAGQASPAALVNMIGVQVRLLDTGGAYHDWGRVRACLRYVGLRHLRSAAPQRNTLGYNLMAKAASEGYLFTFTMRHNRSFTEEIADLETFARAYPGRIAAIEGPNEIDHSPVTFNGRTDRKTDAYANPVAALDYQAALYNAVKSSPVLRSIPVIAFSDFAQAKQRADFSNTHIYPRGGKKLSAMLPGMHKRLDPIGRPIVITETGFHTLPTAKPFPGTDEATQAMLIRDAVRHAPKQGVTRTFLFQLIDDYPPSASMETHFGLFRHDYSPKPAATSLRYMVVGAG